jgi:hypothetical protein
MQTEAHPLELFFHQAVRSSLVDKLGMNDPEIVDYVTHVLCEFSDPDNLYRLKSAEGRKADTLPEMLKAADPVFGTAASFEQERSARKYIGDYALFMAGMHMDVMESAPHFETDRPVVDELIRVGKESYFIVSQFNVFDYAEEAPLFTRLAECLDRCILGLALIREELRERKMVGLRLK